MKIIELSHCLKNKIPIFPGDPEFSLKNISPKEEYYLSELKSGLHSGTHIDAPLHYIKNGKKVNEISLNELIGNAIIFKLDLESMNKTDDKKKIETNDIKNLEIIEEKLNKKINPKKSENPKYEIAILKTEWCNNWQNKNYFHENPYLSNEFAEYLIENNIKTLAIDTCSVDKWEESTIHKKLLKNNINIIENLTNTEKLVKNSYYTEFIPLNINAEASFLRAFAINK